jgi:chromosome segregation ATPase
MSDAGERRGGVGEIRDRLVRVEENQKTASRDIADVKGEVALIRARTHDQGQHLHRLVQSSESADDMRAALAQKIDDLGDEVKAGTVASARTEAQLGATMAAHIEQCKTDKAEIKQLVNDQNAKQDRMHAQNTAGIEKLEVKLADSSKQLTRLEIRIAGYVGAALVIGWLLSTLGGNIAKFIKVALL